MTTTKRSKAEIKRLRKKFDKRFAEQRKARRRNLINNMILRAIGLIIIIWSILIAFITPEHDATHCLVTVPIGLAAFIIPKIFPIDFFEITEELKDDMINLF